MSEWEYNLEQAVILKFSREVGVVIGRAEYMSTEDQYLIRYKAADGRQVEAWWGASAIE